MKKQNYFLKLGLLICGLSILLTNCSENEDALLKETQLERTITQISFDEFKSNISATDSKFEFYSHFIDTNKNAFQKSSNDKSTDEFASATILTDNIIKIKKESFTTYTFPILIQSKNHEFYNLVLVVNNNQFIYRSHILRYTPSDKWLFDRTQNFSGNVEIINNNLFNVDNLIKSDAEAQLRLSNDCVDDVLISYDCSNGIEGHRSGNPGKPICSATGFDEYIEITYGSCPDKVVEMVILTQETLQEKEALHLVAEMAA